MDKSVQCNSEQKIHIFHTFALKCFKNVFTIQKNKLEKLLNKKNYDQNC